MGKQYFNKKEMTSSLQNKGFERSTNIEPTKIQVLMILFIFGVIISLAIYFICKIF